MEGEGVGGGESAIRDTDDEPGVGAEGRSGYDDTLGGPDISLNKGEHVGVWSSTSHWLSAVRLVTIRGTSFGNTAQDTKHPSASMAFSLSE